MSRKSDTIGLWRLGPASGLWEHQRNCQLEEAETWLSVFRRDEPGVAFVLSTKKPPSSVSKRGRAIVREAKTGKNGILMTIGSANKPSSAKENKSGKSKCREYTVPLDELKDLPGMDEAIRRYREFHEGEPTTVRVFDYEDGSDEVDVRCMFRVGEAQIEIDTAEDENGNEVRIKPLKIGSVYKVDENVKSNKSGVQWIHSHDEDGGKPPIHAVDVETGVMSQLGGTYEVRDWMRR